MISTDLQVDNVPDQLVWFLATNTAGLQLKTLTLFLPGLLFASPHIPQGGLQSWDYSYCGKVDLFTWEVLYWTGD